MGNKSGHVSIMDVHPVLMAAKVIGRTMHNVPRGTKLRRQVSTLINLLS